MPASRILCFARVSRLLNRLGRDQEGERDLLGRQPAEGAQGQRHLRLQRQRRVAASEDQFQALVREIGRVVHGCLRSDLELTREQLGLLG